MVWIHLVILFSLVQLAVFSILVGKARYRYGVKAPAITGNEDFERYYRVQMNTIELLILFIPSIILASIYWAPYYMAALGFIYLVGRVVYFKAYINGGNRAVGYLMGLVPIAIFLVLGIFGTLRYIINV